MKQPDVVKYSRKVETRPFEDDSTLQFFSQKSGKFVVDLFSFVQTMFFLKKIK